MEIVSLDRGSVSTLRLRNGGRAMKTGIVRTALAAIALVVLSACTASPPTLEEALAEGDDTGGDWVAAADDAVDDAQSSGADAEPDPEGSATSPDDETPPAELHDDTATDAETVAEAIDEEYFSVVANDLLTVLSDSLRDVVSGGDINTAEAIHHAIFGPPELERRLNSLHEFFYSPEGRQTQLPPEEFGVQRFDVYELIDASEECMSAFGRHDLSETSRFPFPPEEVAVFVLARSTDHDTELNPVGWRIWHTLRLYSEGEPVTIDRVSEIDNLEEVIDLSCGSDER